MGEKTKCDLLFSLFSTEKFAGLLSHALSRSSLLSPSGGACKLLKERERDWVFNLKVQKGYCRLLSLRSCSQGRAQSSTDRPLVFRQGLNLTSRLPALICHFYPSPSPPDLAAAFPESLDPSTSVCFFVPGLC